jgi:predicted RNase H-related nuclease YkuK (DUF458 family)
MDEDNDVAEQQENKEECEENKNKPNYENTDTVVNSENNSDDDYDDDDDDNNVVEINENDDAANASDAEECYDDNDVEENFEERGNLEDDDGMSDKLFSKVLSELITLKSRSEIKKNQSKVIPCAKNFLSLNMSERSKKMTKNVRKNLLHICDFVHQGKFPIDISNDNLRFLRHLLDKRTPKEDVDVGLTEDLHTHAIIREVIDLVEKNGDGARKKPRTR